VGARLWRLLPSSGNAAKSSKKIELEIRISKARRKRLIAQFWHPRGDKDLGR
jgi:hypothetical protein